MPRRLLEPEHRLALWITLLSAIAIFLAISVSGAMLFQGIRGQKETNHAVCVALNNENKLITDTLHRSLRNTPKLAYYHQHPQELAAVLAEIREELHTFRPRHC